MKIEDKLKKKNWKRRVARQKELTQYPESAIDNLKPVDFDKGSFIEVLQSDFLDELDVNSHKIFQNTHRAMRPLYKYNTISQKNEPNGLQEVARVAFSFQKGILGKKVSFAAGAGLWFGNEGGAEDAGRLATIKSYWNLGSFNQGFMEFCEGAFSTGDVAWYAYRNKREVDFKVFRFDKGDTCISALDENGEDVFIRMFSYDDCRAVEIYDSKKITLWVKRDLEDTRGKIVSEDGYVREIEKIHGLTQCPVAYHREPDVCWGAGQNTIERIEDIMSDLAENGKYYSFQILFLSGGAMTLPDSGLQGKVLASKNTDGDAKILAPADASNTFTLDLNTNLQFLWENTSTVIVTPETLKGSNDSGAYLRTLYFKEIQWAMAAHSRMRPALKKFVSIFKEIVGMIEKETSEYDKMKLSYQAVPFIPSNELEQTAIVTQQVYAKILSKETAVGELDRGASNEIDIIKREEKEALKLTEETNPALPGVDNKAEGKEDLIS